MALQTKPIPRIPERPLVGSLGAFQRDRLALLQDIGARCGDVGMMHFGPFPAVVMNRPDLVQAVLVDHGADFDKGLVFRAALRPFLGEGLFTSEGEFHRKQRKTMAPAFQPRNIAGYGDTITGYTHEAEVAWTDGQELDLPDALTALTMRIIGKILFDADTFSEADTLGAGIAEVTRAGDYSLTHLVRWPLPVPTPRNRRSLAALAVVRRSIQAMIDERRRDGRERDDFLSILLRSRDETGQPMSDVQLRDEALTLFGAGHDTTSGALSWAFTLLATHPAAYDRLCEESDRVLAGRLPTVADLPNLPYALQVLKETLRLYPPAYLVSRTALRDVTIDGYALRKGEGVVLSIYTIHRRPDLYPDPERFDPDRFTPEAEKRLPRHAFMPFGAGPRICIGFHLALMEAHLILSTLAGRVRFERLPGPVALPDPVITLKQRPHMQVRVHRRAVSGVSTTPAPATARP
jgi:cytochrome P450